MKTTTSPESACDVAVGVSDSFVGFRPIQRHLSTVFLQSNTALNGSNIYTNMQIYTQHNPSVSLCPGLFSSGAGGGQWVELGLRLEHLFTSVSIAAPLLLSKVSYKYAKHQECNRTISLRFHKIHHFQVQYVFLIIFLTESAADKIPLFKLTVQNRSSSYQKCNCNCILSYNKNS